MSSSLAFGDLQPGDIFQDGQSLYLKLIPVQWEDALSPFANAIQLGHWSLAWMGDQVRIEKRGHQELIIRDGAIQPETWLELALDILPVSQ